MSAENEQTSKNNACLKNGSVKETYTFEEVMHRLGITESGIENAEDPEIEVTPLYPYDDDGFEND